VRRHFSAQQFANEVDCVGEAAVVLQKAADCEADFLRGFYIFDNIARLFESTVHLFDRIVWLFMNNVHFFENIA
jgi:hypothetical protein